MKRYRFVKQEGETRKVLGETVTGLDMSGPGLLVFKSDITSEQVEAFKVAWEKEFPDAKQVFLLVPDGVDVEHMRLEEVSIDIAHPGDIIRYNQDGEAYEYEVQVSTSEIVAGYIVSLGFYWQRRHGEYAIVKRADADTWSRKPTHVEEVDEG